MSYNPGCRAYIAGADLAAKRRVKIKSGTVTVPPEVEYAGAGESHIGQTEFAASTGDSVTIKLKNVSGTHEMTAAGAFAVGAALYGAADGKVDDVVSGSALATAHEAAGADGDIVETLPFA